MIRNITMMIAAASIAIPAIAQAGPGDVVHSFPAPGFYPDGLAWDGTNLWVANVRTAYDPTGFPNTEHLALVDPVSGDTLLTHPTTGHFFHGLAFDGHHLWGDEMYDVIRAIDPTNNTLIDTIDSVGRAYGLTYDPKDRLLYQWDFENRLIHAIRPENGALVKSITPEVTATSSGDLAWDGCYLWQIDDTLIQIDPLSGNALHTLSAPGPHGEGLTWDGTHLWVSDTDTDMLYRVEVPDNWPTGFAGQDQDADLVPDRCDNCPKDVNPDQVDSDANGIGDACDKPDDPGNDPDDPPDDPDDPDNPADPATELGGCSCEISAARDLPGAHWVLGLLIAGLFIIRRRRG